MRIVVDAMGGDHAPAVVVEGAVLAARTFGRPIILVGRAPEVESELARHTTTGLDITVHHASDVIGMDELSPSSAVRARHDNSMSQGMKLIRHGQAEAFVTAGHTGVAMAAAALNLGRIHGVSRAAVATPFPTLGNPCVLIDIGANVEVKPTYLLQFGVMGAVYAERVLGIQRPRVGLLTIGEERGKGTPEVQAALPLLEQSGLNFIGNIEGGDIPTGQVDVAVTDGFTGNIVIKFAEGTGLLVRQIVREATTGNPLSLAGGLLMRPAWRRASQRMDYRSYGGAILLGVRGVVVIGHGRSDPEAVKTAIGVAVRGIESRLVDAIEAGVASAAIAASAASDSAAASDAVARGNRDTDGGARPAGRGRPSAEGAAAGIAAP